MSERHATTRVRHSTTRWRHSTTRGRHSIDPRTIFSDPRTTCSDPRTTFKDLRTTFNDRGRHLTTLEFNSPEPTLITTKRLSDRCPRPYFCALSRHDTISYVWNLRTHSHVIQQIRNSSLEKGSGLKHANVITLPCYQVTRLPGYKHQVARLPAVKYQPGRA